MSLTGVRRLATFKSAVRDEALVIEIDGKQVTIRQDQIPGGSDVALTNQITSAMTTAGMSLPDVYVHRNRDGSLAMAVGRKPKTWPEDVKVSPEEFK